MIRIFRLSETARAILWLWENDRQGWVAGGHSWAHPETGVGIWTSNGAPFVHVRFYVPREDARTGHILSGAELKMKWADRKALWKAFGDVGAAIVPRIISDWATIGKGKEKVNA